MTDGEDRLNSFQDCCSPVISILDSKNPINRTISDTNNGARYCMADSKDFSLCLTIVVIHSHYILQEELAEY